MWEKFSTMQYSPRHMSSHCAGAVFRVNGSDQISLALALGIVEGEEIEFGCASLALREMLVTEALPEPFEIVSYPTFRSLPH